MVLKASDFGLVPRREERPVNDLIDDATSVDIQTLPETVAVFRSNDHGRDLRLLADLWGCWVESLEPGNLAPASKKAVHRACLVATDEFQAVTFNLSRWKLQASTQRAGWRIVHDEPRSMWWARLL